jgi:hypothetical protein
MIAKRKHRAPEQTRDPSPLESLGAAVSEPVLGTVSPDELAPGDRGELRELYQALKAGNGHDRVSMENVDHLIRMASRYGDVTLAAVLREWRAQCVDDPADSKSTKSSER